MTHYSTPEDKCMAREPEARELGFSRQHGQRVSLIYYFSVPRGADTGWNQQRSFESMVDIIKSLRTIPMTSLPLSLES